MPADPTAAQIPGYTFNGWVDGNGDPVTDATRVTGAMTVVADLTPIVTPPTTYKVTFKLFDTDTVAYAEIDVVSGDEIGGQMPADPTAAQIPGYTFNGWVDENGDPVTDATRVTGAMTVVADLTPIVPPATITVEFYEGYGRFAPQIGATLTLDLDTNGEASVAAGDIPTIAYTWTAYAKSEYMETGYADYDGTVKVSPTFMYYKGGEWLPFDETVVLTEDTTVHLFYKYIGLSGFETEVSTKYTDETRVIDSLISLSDNAKDQLEEAKNTGLDIYEKIDGIIYGTLEDKNLIDADRRIKKITIPLPINAALTESLIQDVIEERLSHLHDTPELYDKLFMWPEVEEYLIANGPTIPAGLTQAQIRTLIKTYIDGLTPSETDALVNELCEVIYNTDEYDEVVDAVLNNKKLTVDIDNLKIVKEIQKELETITFDTVMSLSHDSFFDKIVDIAGYSVCADIFDKGRDKYCEDLAKIVYDVENGIEASETIETEFSLLFDPIVDILLPVYDKAQDKAVEKLENANVRYDENPYLQYLVEQHDMVSRLFVDTGIVSEDYSSYAIKDLTDYAAYVVELEIAANDALLWYGEELTETEFNAVYDAVFAKIYTASDKLDGILEDFVDNGELPSKVETAISKIKRINDLFLKYEPKLKSIIEKYLNSSIHDEIANGTIDENERVQTAIDILIGQDDPIFTIDTLFDIFYQKDDKLQEKLQTLLDSGKLDTALEKFKNSPAGDKISDDMINDIVEIVKNVAEYGVEYYQVDTSSDITIVEQYKVEIDGKELIFVRKLVF